MDWARERASSVIAVGRPVDGAAFNIPYTDSHDPVVATLVETGVAELLAAELWRQQGSS
jgi:hypothetical protein